MDNNPLLQGNYYIIMLKESSIGFSDHSKYKIAKFTGYGMGYNGSDWQGDTGSTDDVWHASEILAYYPVDSFELEALVKGYTKS